MYLEVGADERVSLAIESPDVFQTAHAGHLLHQSPVQPGIDAVRVDHDLYELTGPNLDGLLHHPGQRVAQQLHHLLRVAIDHRRHQRFLAREILVERADADASRLRDLADRAARIAVRGTTPAALAARSRLR